MVCLKISSFFFLVIASSVCCETTYAQGREDDDATNQTIEATVVKLRVGITAAAPYTIESDGSLGGLQLDLLEEIRSIAAGQDVELRLELEDIRAAYRPAVVFDLVAHDCHNTTRVEIKSDCDRFDVILAPIFATPVRFKRGQMTPSFLQDWIAAIRYHHQDAAAEQEYSTFADLQSGNGTVCANTKSAYYSQMIQMYPDLNFFHCKGGSHCIPALKQGDCDLAASSHTSLRYLSLSDPTLILTQEAILRNYVVWPMRYNLDEETSRLFKSLVMEAVSKGVVDNLYKQYLEPKICPLGFAGENCQDFCHPERGKSDRLGKCICLSTRFVGDDCSIEVYENTGMIPAYQLGLGYAMFGANIGAVLICSLWLAIHRSKPHVAMAQPFFLGLILLGCTVSSSTILALMQQAEPGTVVNHCMLIPWLYSLGFSITFGTLFTKIYRVHKIIRHAARMRRKKVSLLSAIRWIALVLCVDMGVLIAWQVKDPLVWVRTVTASDKFGIALASFGTCVSDRWAYFLGALVGWHFVLVLGASYMCYTTRKVPNQLSGSKGVAIAMISNCQVFLIGGPVLFLIGSDPGTSFFLRSAMIWVNDLAVVLAVFGELVFGKGAEVSTRTLCKSAISCAEPKHSIVADSSSSHLSKRISAETEMKKVTREIGELKKEWDSHYQVPAAAAKAAAAPSTSLTSFQLDESGTSFQNDDSRARLWGSKSMSA